MIRQILVGFYRLHDIPNIHVKFDNNRVGSFGDYPSTQTAERATHRAMNSRENMKVVTRLTDSNNRSLAEARKTKKIEISWQRRTKMSEIDNGFKA